MEPTQRESQQANGRRDDNDDNLTNVMRPSDCPEAMLRSTHNVCPHLSPDICARCHPQPNLHYE